MRDGLFPKPMYPSSTKPERQADFAVHAISLVGLAILSVFLVQMAAARDERGVLLATVVYVAAILFSVGISFAYHLLPRHDWRPTMRRWDHAAIYVVIAATFSPLLTVAATASAFTILTIIWMFAIVGVWFKIFGKNLDSRWSLLSYLGLGWFALFALPDFWNELPRFSTYAIGIGGLFYTIGTLFYRRKGMRFRYPIWHAFGTLGGSSLYAAIWVALGS